MQDMRLAEILNRHGMPATFYVSPRNMEFPSRELLTVREVAQLAEQFEMGGHTLRHLRLTHLSDQEAYREIIEGREAVEQAAGRKVRSFCYPGGAYSSKHVSMARAAGFEVARTVARGVTNPTAALELGTTVHAYRHLVDVRSTARAAGWNVRTASLMYANWNLRAKALFDATLASGGVYHLWGHSWEIEANNDWARLDDLLRHISGRSDVQYVFNIDLATVSPKISNYGPHDAP